MTDAVKQVEEAILAANILVARLEDNLVFLTDTNEDQNTKHFDYLTIEVAKMILSLTK